MPSVRHAEVDRFGRLFEVEIDGAYFYVKWSAETGAWSVSNDRGNNIGIRRAPGKRAIELARASLQSSQG